MATENPYVPPLAASPAQPMAGWRSPTLWFLLAFYSLAVLLGVNEVAEGDRSGNGRLLSIVLAICLGTWAVMDAKRRGKPIAMSAQAWFLLLALIVVPGYVIVSRGWKGLVLVIVHTVGFIVLTMLAAQFASWARYGI